MGKNFVIELTQAFDITATVTIKTFDTNMIKLNWIWYGYIITILVVNSRLRYFKTGMEHMEDHWQKWWTEVISLPLNGGIQSGFGTSQIGKSKSE